jgi:serine/threonine protein kinase
MVATGALLQGRYPIEEPIKKTSMSAVYKATDQRLGSAVAIKENNCFNDEELSQQFRREARLLANLRHPLLPRVSDHFTEGEGQFLVMEYIPGKDLREMLREREDRNEGPFEPELVLEWADQLLGALEFLHGHPEPIVHRDIKPQNLKLTPRGEVVLLDFGLAKGSPTFSGRKSSSIHGFTLAYASLEQIRDEGTSARSDLYSLGATLYHLMTGVTPADAVERMEARAGGYNPLRPAHELNPQVTPAVSAALDKAMALYPHERPSSAAEMRQMLREAKQNATTDLAAAKTKKLARAPGVLLGRRYRLVELIKQTDISAVYKARDQRLGHVVVLKEHSYSDGVARRELRRAAQLLAGLHHPALPVVTDYFVAGESLFLVMEYIPGKDLREMLREREDCNEGPFKPDLALEWADQLLDALEYLHGQEEPILHLGIKPQNLKIGPRGEVMLLDFGLAGGSLTLSGGSLHSHALTYASLEQIKGEETDPRSDLYSLGATLYRLMTGVTPRNAIERLEARASGYNPLRPAHEHNPQAPPAVSAALDKAMALYPHERPSSAAEMRQTLRQARRKTVIESLPRPSLPKLKMPSRHAIIGAAAILALVVIAILIPWRNSERAAPEISAATPAPAPSSGPVAPSGLPSVQPLGVFSSQGAINQIAVSPDGQFVAIAGEEDVVRLRLLPDSRLWRELIGQQRSGWAVAISPDGQTIAVGSDGGTIRLWSVSDGALTSVLTEPKAATLSVAFCPDGQVVAAGCGDGTIWLWRVSDGRWVKLSEHRKGISSIAFSADGRTLVAGGEDRTIRIWRLK